MKITLIALIAALQLLEIIYYERIGERKTLKVKMIDALFSELIIFVAINLEKTIKKIIVFTIYIVLRCFAEVYKKDIQKQEVIEGIKKQLPTLLICEILGVLMLYSL